MQIFVVLLAIVSVFLLLIKLLGSFSGRISERMITGYFQSAEALLERDKLPDDWNARLTTMAKRRAILERLLPFGPERNPARAYLMKRIKRLHKFFGKCPFVESPEAREMLLDRLDVVIDRWEKSDLPEILRYYDSTIDGQI